MRPHDHRATRHVRRVRALPKAYDPHEVEPRWNRIWEERGYYHAEDQSSKPPFSISIPPPNVTGSLHIGHALTVSIEDLLIRWKRMSGFNTLWMPGTDHAGIATQMVVERELKKTEKKTRHDLGREEFLKRVWQWKEQYGNAHHHAAAHAGLQPGLAAASASPWTRASRARCARSSCASTKRA